MKKILGKIALLIYTIFMLLISPVPFAIGGCVLWVLYLFTTLQDLYKDLLK